MKPTMSGRSLRTLLFTLLVLGAIYGNAAYVAGSSDASARQRQSVAQQQTQQATPDAPLAPSSWQLYVPLLVNGSTLSDPASSSAKSTPALIQQAFDRGEITAAQRLLYLAYALYEPRSLPARFQSNVGWFGTPYVIEVQNNMQSVSAAAADATQAELGRMGVLAATICDNEDLANSTNSTNFRLNYGAIGGGLTLAHYSTSLEATFGVEVTSYGWAKPPLCTGGATCNGNANPFGRYPVQIVTLGSGLYGYVTTGGLYSGFVGNNPNTAATETAAFASCMVLNDDYSPFSEGAQAALDATTAHEFVHSIQFGYGDAGANEDSMWYESAASYMEDDVFDSSNSNYYYLWPVVSNSLGEWPDNGAPGGISQYSNFLFFRHVAEHSGGANTAGGGEDVMQRFWENVAAGQDALVAYNNALSAEGTTLADAFHRYAIAARFSKTCSAGYTAPYCFEEGAAYVAAAGAPSPAQGSIVANPGSFVGSIRNHYAANWIGLPTSGSPYQVTLSNTSGGGQLRGSLVCDTGSALTITPFAAVVGAGSSTTIGSFSSAGCTSVAAVISNQEQTSGNPSSTTAHNYTLAISASTPSTNTPTPTNTPTRTNTPTPTATTTPPTATPTPTNTPTNSPTPTATSSPTPVATIIQPDDGGTLTAPVAGLDTSLSVPPGAVSEPIRVTIQTVADAPPAGGFTVLGQSFAVEVYTLAGDPVTQFAQPLTIVVHYSDDDLDGLDENGLQIHYWDEAMEQWVAIPTVVDPQANTLTAQVDHLTLFAVLGSSQIYLPSIRR